MPRNTREWAKRKLKEAEGNLDWALFHLNEVEEKYREYHPDISDSCLSIMQLANLATEALQVLGASF